MYKPRYHLSKRIKVLRQTVEVGIFIKFVKHIFKHLNELREAAKDSIVREVAGTDSAILSAVECDAPTSHAC